MMVKGWRTKQVATLYSACSQLDEVTAWQQVVLGFEVLA
jgi:hypothetical protein